MTEKHAMALEALMEKRLKLATEKDIEISMALTGRLKIDFDGCYINLNRKDFTIDYMRYTGSFHDFTELHGIICRTLEAYREDVDELIWSYDNRNELKKSEEPSGGELDYITQEPAESYDELKLCLDEARQGLAETLDFDFLGFGEQAKQLGQIIGIFSAGKNEVETEAERQEPTLCKHYRETWRSCSCMDVTSPHFCKFDSNGASACRYYAERIRADE